MDKQYLQLLQAMPIFGGIHEQALELLIQNSPEIIINKGEYFFKEADPADSLFILKHGKVLIVKGEDTYLQSLQDGDCFGEMSVIDLNPRSASVLATEDCLALQVSQQTLFMLYEHHLAQFTLIQMNLLREVSRRLRALDEKLMRIDKELLKLIHVL